MARLLTMTREMISQEDREKKSRQERTSKHDIVWLLHLRKDPAATADWTAALREKSRAALGSSNNVIAANYDPWNRLTERFNDYMNLRHQTLTILPTQLFSIAYTPASEMDSLPKFCFGTNSTVAH